MEKFYKLAIFTLFVCLPLSITSAQTMEEKIRSLEATVNQLQDTLIKMRAEMKKSSDEKKGSVSSDENIELSTTGGGLKLKTDKGDEFQFGGRLMLDYDSFDIDESFELNDGDASEAEWRRTRLTAKGKVKEDWKYVFTVNIDDAGEDADVDTAYIQYNGMKPLSVTVGKFKQPFGLEQLTSSKWMSAIEHFWLGEEVLGGFGAGKPDTGGVMLSGYHEEASNLNWFLGIFDDGQEDSDGDDKYNFGVRIAGSPHFADGSFLHLGIAYADQDRDASPLSVEPRFGIHTAPPISLIGTRMSEDASHWGVEAAYVRGPFSLQAEYMDLELDGALWDSDTPSDDTDDRMDSDLDADGYYVQGTWTLTGESRSYKTQGAYFDKIKPQGPRGAWELVARWEDVDIEHAYQVDDDPANDIDVNASVEKWLLGVNWYANNNIKFMLNYVDVDVDDAFRRGNPNTFVAGEIDSVSLRAQYAF